MQYKLHYPLRFKLQYKLHYPLRYKPQYKRPFRHLT
jgi:hypothetical protein